MRFPNQRLAQLFSLLQNETLPQDELAQRLSVSTRTVRADITALNALLMHYGAQFVLTRGSGYQLKIDDPSRYQTLEETAPKPQHIPRTAQDRIHFLLVRFLTSAFSLKLRIWPMSGLSAGPRCKAIWPRYASALPAIS